MARPAAGPGARGARYTAPLAAFGRDGTSQAGGKGANLGELVRAGFPVPPGFVVTTAAYDLVLARSGLGGRLPGLLAEAPGGAAVRAALLAAPVPDELAGALRAAYRELGGGSVAVRSSATAEDLPEATFAGQQESYLNVAGEGALLEAVRRCWASLWTERALAYRQRLGLDPTAARMAVVVQRMVPAEAAGVLFTANPVTGARGEVVVDAAAGLGEAVAGGRVTPDHYVLGKRSGRLVSWRPGRPGAAGPVLPGRALRRLARLGTAAERRFGAPQDVEWAWAGGQAYILQARPITALPAPPPRAGPVRRMVAAAIAELFPVRPYPLDMTTWTGALLDLASTLAGSFGIRSPWDRAFVEEGGVVVRLNPPAVRPTLRALPATARLLRQARRYDPVGWRADPLLAEVQARAGALAARDLEALPWPGLIATLREAVSATWPAIAELRLRYLPAAGLALLQLRVLLGLLGRGDRTGALLADVKSKTIEINQALAGLAAAARADPTLAGLLATREPAELLPALEAEPAARPFLARFRAFLDRYGHQAALTPLLASQPTWQDAPETVLAMLKALAAAPPRAGGRPAGEAARAELLAHPLLRLPPLRSAVLARLERARLVMQLREDTRFYALLPLPTARRAIHELGRRLAAAGALGAPEDVYHLTLQELERAGAAWPPPGPLARELRALAGRRKARRAALAGTPLVDPRLLAPAGGGGGALLRGAPGSPGVAEGPARVIRAAAESGRLRPGEVLVAEAASPAWTPLFQQAAAVVTDTGGVASHAAVVAREYGIPAVMATGDATRRLADGQRVRVDGGRGLVLPALPPRHARGDRRA